MSIGVTNNVIPAAARLHRARRALILPRTLRPCRTLHQKAVMSHLEKGTHSHLHQQEWSKSRMERGHSTTCHLFRRSRSLKADERGMPSRRPKDIKPMATRSSLTPPMMNCMMQPWTKMSSCRRMTRQNRFKTSRNHRKRRQWIRSSPAHMQSLQLVSEPQTYELTMLNMAETQGGGSDGCALTFFPRSTKRCREKKISPRRHRKAQTSRRRIRIIRSRAKTRWIKIIRKTPTIEWAKSREPSRRFRFSVGKVARGDSRFGGTITEREVLTSQVAAAPGWRLMKRYSVYACLICLMPVLTRVRSASG